MSTNQKLELAMTVNQMTNAHGWLCDALMHTKDPVQALLLTDLLEDVTRTLQRVNKVAEAIAKAEDQAD